MTGAPSVLSSKTSGNSNQKNDGGIDQYVWVGAFKVTIDFIQLLGFCFKYIDWGPYGNAFGNAILYAQVAPPIQDYFGQLGQISLVIVFLITITFTFASAAYNLYSFYTKNFIAGVWPLRVLKFTVQWQSNVLFIPTLVALVSVRDCNPETTFFFACNGPTHNLVIGITGVFSILFGGLIMSGAFKLLMSIAYFQPDPRSPNFDARPLPIAEFIEITFKLSYIIIAEAVNVRAPYVLMFMMAITSSTGALLGMKTFPISVFWAGSVGAVTALYHPQEPNLMFYIFLGGMVIILPLYALAFMRVKRKIINKEFLLEAIEYIDTQDLNGESKAKALMKRLNVKIPRDAVLRARFVWKDITPENLEAVERLFQYAIEYFTPDHDMLMRRARSRRKRNEKQIKYKLGSAYLNEQYGLFLKLLKNDFTLSQLYFKRASQMDPPLAVQIVIYQAEKDRRERLIEQERGGAIKMDAVDRVEYRQLLKQATFYHRETAKYKSSFWKILTLGNATFDDLSNLFQKLERSERECSKYYHLLHTRFGYIPRVLQQYADYLDLAGRVDESENVRRELEEVLEEIEVDEQADEKMQFSGSGIDADSASKKGDDFAALSERRQSSATANLGLPPPIIRPPKERRALKAYKRTIVSVQNHYRRRTSFMIAGFCFGLFLICTATMASVEYLLVNQVHTSGNMSFWAVRASFSLRQMHIAAVNNDELVFNMTANELGETIDMMKTANDYLFYGNDRVDDDYKEKIVPWVAFMGLDASPPFQVKNMSLIDSTRWFITRASELRKQPMSYFNVPLEVNNGAGSISVMNHTLGADWRGCNDNFLSLLLRWDKITDYLTLSNEKEILVVMIVLLAMYSFWVVLLLCMGIFVFAPFVGFVERQRRAAMEAFLKLPQATCIDMFLKYRFDKRKRREGDDDDDDVDSNESGSDDDEENGDLAASQSSLKGKASRFRSIKAGYIWALIYFLELFTMYTAFDVVWLKVQMSNAGRRLQRSAEIPFLVQGFAALNTERIYYDPISAIPVEQFVEVLHEEVCHSFRNTVFNKVQLDYFMVNNKALMYGNNSQSVVPYKLSNDEREYFFGKNYQNKSISLDSLCNRLLYDAARLMLSPQISVEEPSYQRLLLTSPDVVRGYVGYAEKIKSNFYSYEQILSLVSTKIMYPIIVFFLLVIYFKSFQDNLRMVIEESSKTIRLILMIPMTAIINDQEIRVLLDHGEDSLDIPELHALTGGTEDSKLREIIKTLNKKPEGVRRSSSTPNLMKLHPGKSKEMLLDTKDQPTIVIANSEGLQQYLNDQAVTTPLPVYSSPADAEASVAMSMPSMNDLIGISKEAGGSSPNSSSTDITDEDDLPLPPPTTAPSAPEKGLGFKLPPLVPQATPLVAKPSVETESSVASESSEESEEEDGEEEEDVEVEEEEEEGEEEKEEEDIKEEEERGEERDEPIDEEKVIAKVAEVPVAKDIGQEVTTEKAEDQFSERANPILMKSRSELDNPSTGMNSLGGSVETKPVEQEVTRSVSEPLPDRLPPLTLTHPRLPPLNDNN
ncbi:hypothetical protein HDU97_000791 [Phlyctochytrium planicorne]|nr:hypothetical protein HDU97_000791 [Phlyctochytrium planicorne]